MSKLLSVSTMVEAPFIIVEVGGYKFGQISKHKNATGVTIDFPNFVKNVTIKKVNGEVNTYTINMSYQISPGSDPNLVDKIFSSVADTRTLTISYGDYNSPGHIFKEEETLITNVKSNLNFSSSNITYVVTCVSKAMSLLSTNHNFPAVKAKPSSIIFRLLTNSSYGLTNAFKGMLSISKVIREGLICTDDKEVQLDAKPLTNVLEYLNYLVTCMIPDTAGSSVHRSSSGTLHGGGSGTFGGSSTHTSSSGATHGGRGGNLHGGGGGNFNTEISNSIYKMTIVDDNKNKMGGSYFTVTKVSAQAATSLEDAYEIDVGFPGDNFVTSFSLRDSEQWTILYDNSTSKPEQFTYKFDNEGVLIKEPSNSLTRSKSKYVNEADETTWWTEVTQFPISASMTLKGLVRPTMLMSYVKINVIFYGRKHISSGTYIITEEEDTVSESGYRTSLSLLRVSGD